MMPTEADVFDALKQRVVVDRHGSRLYYNHDGVLHRENGPAIEWADGDCWWFLFGVRYNYAQYLAKKKSLGL